MKLQVLRLTIHPPLVALVDRDKKNIIVFQNRLVNSE